MFLLCRYVRRLWCLFIILRRLWCEWWFFLWVCKCLFKLLIEFVRIVIWIFGDLVLDLCVLNLLMSWFLCFWVIVILFYFYIIISFSYLVIVGDFGLLSNGFKIMKYMILKIVFICKFFRIKFVYFWWFFCYLLKKWIVFCLFFLIWVVSLLMLLNFCLLWMCLYYLILMFFLYIFCWKLNKWILIDGWLGCFL